MIDYTNIVLLIIALVMIIIVLYIYLGKTRTPKLRDVNILDSNKDAQTPKTNHEGIAHKYALHKESKSLKKEVKTLERAYKEGFISRKEYNEALKHHGYTCDNDSTNTSALKHILVANMENNTDNSDNIFVSTADDHAISGKIRTQQKHHSKLPNIIVNDDKAFIMHDGRKLCSIMDLVNASENMAKYVFDHHTKEGRNDFSDWIKNVFFNEELAFKVRSADTIEELRRILKENT